ncbi:MAG: GyrI-like domain-containing protein [Pseudomonadota bacterium]
MDPITIETLPAQPVCEVDAAPRLWQIPSVIANCFGQATAQIETAGAERTGMPHARYLEIDWATMKHSAFRQMLGMLFKRQKMKAGFHLARPHEVDGRPFGSEIPAGRYATTIHRGAYHKVGETYSRVLDWANEQGLELADNTIESYIDDPGEMPMEEVRTQVFVPLVD